MSKSFGEVDEDDPEDSVPFGWCCCRKQCYQAGNSGDDNANAQVHDQGPIAFYVGRPDESLYS